MAALRLPSSLKALLTTPRPRRPRDSAVLDLAALNGFRSSEIAAVNRNDVDLKQRRIHRHGRHRSYWQPLLVTDVKVWETLLSGLGQEAQEPVFTSVRGNRLSRVDVWRILRSIGRQEKQKKPLTTRRLRRILGTTVAKKHKQSPSTTAAVLGLTHLDSVQRYHPRPDWSDYPVE